jgi:hypothetical protein
MEGVSEDVFVFFSVCLISIGCGYLGDRLLSRNQVRSIPQFASAVDNPQDPGAVDSSQGPRSISTSPRTAPGYSESDIAVHEGQLPLCPICLDQVSNAVETSWYHHMHEHTDLISRPSSPTPNQVTSRQSVSSPACWPAAMHSARSASWRCGSEPEACKAAHDSLAL